MSRIHPEEYWEDGDIYSPDEPNREFAAIAGEMNGHIDADNISALLITGAKAALDLFHEIIWVEDAGPDTFSEENTDLNNWQVLETVTVTTGDGRLKLEGQCSCDCEVFVTTAQIDQVAHFELGIMLDGDVVARSGWSSGLVNSETATCIGAPFVAPGSHTVELAIRRAGAGTTLDITVNGRSLFGRYLAR